MLRHTISVTSLLGEPVVHNKWVYPMSDIVDQGREGFRKNRKNPFHLSSDRFREWERGYNKAYFETLRKVKHEEQLRTVST